MTTMTTQHIDQIHEILDGATLGQQQVSKP
jgi:hypothetical protein